MSDSDLVKLYSGQILQLAGSIPHLGHLSAPMGRARKRSVLCGSTIAVELQVANDRVSDFAQDVRACALGQASAAILGRVVIGRSAAELAAARDQLAQMLATGGAAPEGAFAGYEVLRAARDYKNRHASILLALDATIAAMADATA